MKRLTNSGKEIPTLCNNEEYWLKAYFKLKDYEDLEEQGLLLKLLCKVGDTVYLIKSDGKVVPRTSDMMFLGMLWDEYDKKLFLTQQQAEKKLKESGGCYV